MCGHRVEGKIAQLICNVVRNLYMHVPRRQERLWCQMDDAFYLVERRNVVVHIKFEYFDRLFEWNIKMSISRSILESSCLSPFHIFAFTNAPTTVNTQTGDFKAFRVKLIDLNWFFVAFQLTNILIKMLKRWYDLCSFYVLLYLVLFVLGLSSSSCFGAMAKAKKKWSIKRIMLLEEKRTELGRGKWLSSVVNGIV